MRAAIIAALVAFSGLANALTLSPMVKDELVYTDFYLANLKLQNGYESVMYYDVWVVDDVKKIESKDALYSSSAVVGGNGYKNLSVPITRIKPDILGVYYICVQERPGAEKMAVVGRVCAKFRLFWPRSELLKLQ